MSRTWWLALAVVAMTALIVPAHAHAKPASRPLRVIIDETIQLVCVEYPQHPGAIDEELKQLVKTAKASRAKLQAAADALRQELGGLTPTLTATCSELRKPKINRAALQELTNRLIAQRPNLEAKVEEVKNKRQECMTSFESFDQKANQLFNLLSTVMKNEQEMLLGISRNLLE